nr:MAG TPA: hypothetical protein [Caudoviricetes sp.]
MWFTLNKVLKIIFFILFSPFGFKSLFSVDGNIIHDNVLFINSKNTQRCIDKLYKIHKDVQTKIY